METSEGQTPSKEIVVPQKRKLIRDRYPEIFKKKGVKRVTGIAESTEYGILLDEKLTEEAMEWMEAYDPKELADVLEVIDAQCVFRTRKYTPVSLRKISESDKELIQAIKTAVNDPDRDIFNGMFLSQIDKWSQTHDFKDLARVMGIVHAAGQLSRRPANIAQLEGLRHGKHAELGGFTKRVVLEPETAV